MDRDELNAGLTEKVNEYQIMSAPLSQAIKELEYAQSLLRARCEHDIAQTIPALGALAEILDISSLDLLMSDNRLEFLQAAMERHQLTADDVARQMRALVESPESRNELRALGISEKLA